MTRSPNEPRRDPLDFGCCGAASSFGTAGTSIFGGGGGGGGGGFVGVAFGPNSCAVAGPYDASASTTPSMTMDRHFTRDMFMSDTS